MDWNDLDIFLAVAASASFTHAAGRLELPKSSVSRAVTRLEQRLGARLFERSTRRITLTEDGRQLQQQTQPLFERLRDILADTQARRDQPHGVLRIAASHEFGMLRLSPIVNELLQQHPGLEAEITLTPTPPDPLAGGYDIVFRIQSEPLQDSSLIARHVYAVRSQLYAAPALIEQRGRPATPADLADWPCIAHPDEDVWSFQDKDGAITEIHPRGPLRSPHQGIRQRAVLAGLGAGLLTEVFYRPEVAAGRLRALLPEYQVPPSQVYALLPSRRLMPARVRVFLDALTASLARENLR